MKIQKIKEHNLNETVSANTCGLNLVVCSGCHKTMYEDKFMLNKANKRYRSCINCVSRARTARQNKEQNHVLKNTDKGKVLAILDKDYINIDDEVHDDIIIVKPSNDKPSNDKPKQIKTKKKINSNNHIFSLLTTEPEIEPEEVGLRLFKLFN